MSIFAPGTAASARALISSKDCMTMLQTLKGSHRGMFPLGNMIFCNLVTHVTFLTLSFDLRRMKDIGICRRLQIVRTKGGYRKLARLIYIKVLGLRFASKFLTVDLALQFHESVQQRFGPGRAAWNVNIDRDVTVDSFEDIVTLFEWPPGNRAGAH